MDNLFFSGDKPTGLHRISVDYELLWNNRRSLGDHYRLYNTCCLYYSKD